MSIFCPGDAGRWFSGRSCSVPVFGRDRGEQEAGEDVIRLYDHNQAAYSSVLSLLSDVGKAAVIHPTGTGKSFIAFKLAEDHPDQSFLWLSPSEQIYCTQLENVEKATGFAARNIHFCTYAKLINCSEEDMLALSPDYIVLDEFHRAGAPRWGKSVRALLACHPGAKLLGLSATNIRYLDDRRDMALELFDGSVADRMSLAEAVAAGILPAPEYVVSLYAYHLDLDAWRSRLGRVGLPARRAAEECLEKLRHAVEKAQGLEEIFYRHMRQPHGKYIVFCANCAHMREVMARSAAWFRKVDDEPHFYSVWSGSPAAGQDYRAFREDGSDHLRLLFCIDMFNEGVHVEDLSGVILFRPTVSPIIFKQQIGRALSALRTGDSSPVVFDIVNNFENLQVFYAPGEEQGAEYGFAEGEGDPDPAALCPFQLVDEVRECRELFRKLEDILTVSWDMMYREAKAYYDRFGHLRVPERYRTPEGYPLGMWIQTQRRLRKGEQGGSLAEERIRLLDEIGMIWLTRSQTAWETGLEHVRAYSRAFGNLEVAAQYVSPDGYRLGAWLTKKKQEYGKLRKDGLDPLSVPEFRELDALGLRWRQRDMSCMRGLEAAEAYAARFGNLEIPVDYVTEEGFKLGLWIHNQRAKGKKQEKTDQQQALLSRLDALGMRWSGVWEENFRQAKSFFDLYHHLNPSRQEPAEGFNLGRWLSHQREQYRAGRLPEERVKRLEAIGMEWNPESAWDHYYGLARQYYLKYGDLAPQYAYTTAEGALLGRWLTEQRLARKNGSLSEERIRKLDLIRMRWVDRNEDRFDLMLGELTRWVMQHKGSFPMPVDTKTADGTNLRRWVRKQMRRRNRGEMPAGQKEKWDECLKGLAGMRFGEKEMFIGAE